MALHDAKRRSPCDKECSAYKGLAGDICTITSSNLEEIEVGSKVVYAQAAVAGSLDTDIVLDAGDGNTGAGLPFLLLWNE